MLLRHCCWCGPGFMLLLLLLHPRERWRSIVMSTSVCVCVWVCVCVSVCARSYHPNNTRDVCHFLHVAYRRGSVLLRRGNEIPRGTGNFGGSLAHLQFTVQHSIGAPYNNGWTIEMPFGMMTRVGPGYHVLDGGSDPPMGRGNYGGKLSSPL